MRIFKEMIFCGAGDSSLHYLNKLRERLEEAIVLMGGLQQPRMSTEPPESDKEKQYTKYLKQDLCDAILDIRTALGEEHWGEIKMEKFDTVKVFSATKARDREVLGEKITDWLRQHHQLEVVRKIIKQSSDQSFHCLSITLFLRKIR